VADVPVGHPDFGKLIACRCTVQRREAARQRRVQAALTELQAQMGTRLAQARFATFDLDRRLAPAGNQERVFSLDEQRQMLAHALEVVQTWSAEPFGWLYLHGPPGGGKTHLAAAAVAAAAERGWEGSYASVPDLVTFVQAGFGDHSASGRIAALKTVPLLLLDDLGTENRSEYNQRLVFELLNARYNDDRPTVITSNLAVDRQEARLASRIHELATVLPLIVSDYRRGGGGIAERRAPKPGAESR
jgi:DNA replication protein DnaC